MEYVIIMLANLIAKLSREDMDMFMRIISTYIEFTKALVTRHKGKINGHRLIVSQRLMSLVSHIE